MKYSSSNHLVFLMFFILPEFTYASVLVGHINCMTYVVKESRKIMNMGWEVAITEKSVKVAFARTKSGRDDAIQFYEETFGKYLRVLGIEDPNKNIPKSDVLSKNAIQYIARNKNLTGHEKAEMYERLILFIQIYYPLSFDIRRTSFSEGKILYGKAFQENILLINTVDGSVWSGKRFWKSEEQNMDAIWDEIVLEVTPSLNEKKNVRYILKKISNS